MVHRWEPPHRLLPRQCGPLPLSMPLIWTHLLYLAGAYLAPLTKRLFVWIPAFAGMTKTPSCPRKRAPIIFTLGHWTCFVRHSWLPAENSWHQARLGTKEVKPESEWLYLVHRTNARHTTAKRTPAETNAEVHAARK